VMPHVLDHIYKARGIPEMPNGESRLPNSGWRWPNVDSDDRQLTAES
jgi:hypothetical protein